MRLPLPLLVLGVLAALAAGAGCGRDESKLIDRDEARPMVEDLNRVERALDDGRCSDARSALQTLSSHAAELSPRVDTKLRERLGEGIDALADQVPDECESKDDTTTGTTTTTTGTGTTTTTGKGSTGTGSGTGTGTGTGGSGTGTEGGDTGGDDGGSVGEGGDPEELIQPSGGEESP